MQVGDNLAGYEICAKLSSGGMATLFLGRRLGAGGFAKYVAVKVVHAHLAEDEAFVEMFLDEARLSARIEHPNVVHVHDLGDHEGNYYLVMEYIPGCSLGQLLRVISKRKLKLAPEVAVSIAMKVASALHAAHELTDSQGKNLGVVHRDVSPQNILLSFKGHVKLIDFGIAKAADRSQQTQGAVFKGKIRYAAPEQAYGKDVDRRADIYALGIVLWELLTTQRLFDGESDFDILEQVRNPKVKPPSSVVSGISPALDNVLVRTLSKDPENRPQTAEELRRELAAAVPAALAIDSHHVSDLIAVLMSEFVEAESRKLGSLSAISQVLGQAQPSANAQEIVEKMVAPLVQRPALPLPGRAGSSGAGGRAPIPVRGGVVSQKGNAATSALLKSDPAVTGFEGVEPISAVKPAVLEARPRVATLDPVSSAVMAGAIVQPTKTPGISSTPYLRPNAPAGAPVKVMIVITLIAVASLVGAIIFWVVDNGPRVVEIRGGEPTQAPAAEQPSTAPAVAEDPPRNPQTDQVALSAQAPAAVPETPRTKAPGRVRVRQAPSEERSPREGQTKVRVGNRQATIAQELD